MLEKLVCSENVTLLEVLRTINQNGKGIAFLVASDGRMTGVLTDGDIRNRLLENVQLSELARNVMNKNFACAINTEPLEAVLRRFNKDIKIIPIVDKAGRPVDVFEYRNEFCLPVAAPDLKGNELQYLTDAFLSTWISSQGRYIERFEQGFAKFCRAEHAVAVSNGTVALHLALVTLGIGPGDEVIVPDLTFAATINTVLHAGATPVIVDIEEDSWGLDPLELEKAITPRTKAVVPVHLYGQPCDMGAIMRIARQHDLYVIEDCAEAHGAEYDGKPVGSIGDIGCFSFYGNKVITTGEGGMCVTNSSDLDTRMRVLRDHGMSKTRRYYHEFVGFNYRMTNLQAAIGCAQLERIGEILRLRSEVEKKYRQVAGKFPFLSFQREDLDRRKKITWLVSVLVDEKHIQRDELISRMRSKGADSRPFFVPLSQMDIYKKYCFSNKVSVQVARRGINLPTYNDLNFIREDWFNA